MKKYEIIENQTIKYEGRTLYRIKALKNFVPIRSDKPIIKGTIGGYVESEKNLSQKGTCWIDKDAISMDNALVQEKAFITDKAIIKNDAWVEGAAYIGGQTIVSDNAYITDNATITGKSIIKDCSEVSDLAIVENEIIDGDTWRT